MLTLIENNLFELTVISAIVIGLSLGVFGSGGAILTLPTLIYLLGYDEKSAVIGSLFVVAIISFFTAIPQWFKSGVSKSHLFYFAFPGLVGSYAGAYLGSSVEPEIQIIVFVTLMFVAAVKMLTMDVNKQGVPVHNLILIVIGLLVGLVTGFIGVGGGFLIVPALVLLSNLSINKAVSTSVVIIFLQSTMGLISYHEHSMELFSQIQWSMLIVIGVIGIVGSYIGLWLQQFINQKLLTKLFGCFLILIASFILIDKIFT